MPKVRIATQEERMAAFIAATEPCLDCGVRGLKSKPCGNCEADEQARKDMELNSRVPPVLRVPPYAHCVGNMFVSALPENAGRHAAPRQDESETLQTIGMLSELRGLGGHRHC